MILNLFNVSVQFSHEFFLNFPLHSEGVSAETPRRRRHQQQQAISMMLMGISLFLMVFVPMGFNFLSALGGKAFLMAKLALLLASVNGLKRVRNNFKIWLIRE
jgi:Protein of unknown function (DUF1676)